MIMLPKIRFWEALKNSVLRNQKRWNHAVGKSLEGLTHRERSEPTFVVLCPCSNIKKREPAQEADRKVRYHDVRTHTRTLSC